MNKLFFLIIVFALISCRNDEKVIARWENDTPKEVRYYKNHEDTFEYVQTLFYRTGIIKEKGDIIQTDTKTRNGQWSYYYKSGNLKEYIFYLNGVKFDKYLKYFENGNIWEKGTYNLNGLPDGIWTEYYKDGTIKAEGKYFEGVKVYDWNYYNSAGLVIKNEEYTYSGLLKLEKHYLNQDKTSHFEYNNYGRLISKGVYNNEEKHGLWIYYNEDGSNQMEIFHNADPFEDNLLMSYWDTLGNQLIKDGTGKITYTKKIIKNGIWVTQQITEEYLFGHKIPRN